MSILKSLGVVLVGLMVLGALPSRADIAVDVKVVGVGVHWGNTGYSYIEGIPACGIFYNSITDERWKYFHSTLLAAKLAGRNLQRVDFTVTDAAKKFCTLELVEF